MKTLVSEFKGPEGLAQIFKQEGKKRWLVQFNEQTTIFPDEQLAENYAEDCVEGTVQPRVVEPDPIVVHPPKG